MQNANKKLEVSNPAIVSEQKDLIIDLKTRVNILEKELTLVTNQTARDIDNLRKEKEALTGNLIGVNGQAEQIKHNEKTNMHKVS